MTGGDDGAGEARLPHQEGCGPGARSKYIELPMLGVQTSRPAGVRAGSSIGDEAPVLRAPRSHRLVEDRQAQGVIIWAPQHLLPPQR